VLKHGMDLCQVHSGYSAQALIKRLESTKESIYFQPHLSPLIDCFNQMGNVTFLRKRNSILKQDRNAQFLIDIKNAYSEYFSSVREALTLIEKGLYQIEAQFKS
jgi:hypothetical protein